MVRYSKMEMMLEINRTIAIADKLKTSLLRSDSFVNFIFLEAFNIKKF